MILLILLILLFLLVIVHLVVKRIEGFADIPLSNEFLENYKKFVDFYNPFLVNWEKAIVSAVSLDIPREPLSSPQQKTTDTKPPTISRIEQNTYIAKLSKDLQKPFPFITDPLPSSIDVHSLPELLNLIPKDSNSYQNALQWMNTKLEDSQQQLKQSLKGIPPVETFVNQCGNVSQCLLDNQEFITKVGEEIRSSELKREAQKREQQEKELMNRMNSFNQNTSLLQSAKSNQTLMKQADTTKQQAESGQLYKQLNLPDTPSAPIILPKGSNTLTDMQKMNPEQYNQLKDNYSQLFSLKSLFEQINQNL